MNNISEYFCPSDYNIEGNKCYKSEPAISVVTDNYNVGNAVLYNGSYWYVLSSNDDYLTLLKKEIRKRVEKTAKGWNENNQYAVDFFNAHKDKVSTEELIEIYKYLDEQFKIEKNYIDLDDEETPAGNIDLNEGGMSMAVSIGIGVFAIVALIALILFAKKKKEEQ